MTQPIGTSPAFAAFSAVLSAKSMKEGAVMPRIIGRNLLVDAPSATVDPGFAWDSAADSARFATRPAPSVRPFMPRDSDKNNDSRGRRDRPAAPRGRSGAARGPEKKFAKRGFGAKDSGAKDSGGKNGGKGFAGKD